MQWAIFNQQICRNNNKDTNVRGKYNRIKTIILNKQYWAKTKKLKALLTPFL